MAGKTGGRKAVKITKLQLKEKILKKLGEDYASDLKNLVSDEDIRLGIYEFLENCPKANEDIQKIQFDFENYATEKDDGFGTT